MENSIKQNVIIVGAGPAGLILGYYLKKMNVDYLILEKNDEVGATWSQMPDHLHLITFWHSNCLLKQDLSLSPLNKAHRAGEFAEYLKKFSADHELRVKLRHAVLSIKKENNNFLVKTQSDQYRAGIVVDCRGYFNYPFIPKLSIEGNAPLMIHFKDYKNCLPFKNYKKILIVGKRLSAGQLLSEFSKSGQHELFLSARSQIKYGPPTPILNFFLKYLNFFEGLKQKLGGNLKTEIEVPMHHSVKKIVQQETKVLGDISKIVNKKVFFDCGNVQEIDAIIFATGFKPAEVSFKTDFESATEKNLFYLGRGAQRSFTSRFIRGIRKDAPILCQEIFGKLESSNKLQ